MAKKIFTEKRLKNQLKSFVLSEEVSIRKDDDCWENAVFRCLEECENRAKEEEYEAVRFLAEQEKHEIGTLLLKHVNSRSRSSFRKKKFPNF